MKNICHLLPKNHNKSDNPKPVETDGMDLYYRYTDGSKDMITRKENVTLMNWYDVDGLPEIKYSTSKEF